MNQGRLVEELRRAHAEGRHSCSEWTRLFKAAADRIEFLAAVLERLSAENARLAAEVERLTLVAEMVELRSLIGEVREGDPDKDDGGRQIVINLISLRDEFNREANDAAAARAVVVQDGLSFIHRLVRQQNAMLGEKLQRLSAAGAIAVREPKDEGEAKP